MYSIYYGAGGGGGDVGMGKIGLRTERGRIGFKADWVAHGVYVIFYNFKNPPKARKENQVI